jgi:gas vesicle protein GvpK
MTMPALRPRAPGVRVELDPDDVGRGFATLVLALAEAVRELLERQAIRRIDAGDLDATQIERLGSALLAARRQLTELREALDERPRETEHRKDMS